MNQSSTVYGMDTLEEKGSLLKRTVGDAFAVYDEKKSNIHNFILLLNN